MLSLSVKLNEESKPTKHHMRTLITIYKNIILCCCYGSRLIGLLLNIFITYPVDLRAKSDIYFGKNKT